jgi:hypothetical protein
MKRQGSNEGATTIRPPDKIAVKVTWGPLDAALRGEWDGDPLSADDIVDAANRCAGAFQLVRDMCDPNLNIACMICRRVFPTLRDARDAPALAVFTWPWIMGDGVRREPTVSPVCESCAQAPREELSPRIKNALREIDPSYEPSGLDPDALKTRQ